MGAYLSEPITKTESSDGSVDALSYGSSSMQGWRVYQEDAHNNLLDFDKDTFLFAVYDGHGGHEVSAYAADKLPAFLKSLEAYKDGNISQALIDAFLGFDASLVESDVLDILKALKEGNEELPEEDSESERQEVDTLWKEASMPLEEVMKKYEKNEFQSPYVRPKKTKDEGCSSGSNQNGDPIKFDEDGEIVKKEDKEDDNEMEEGEEQNEEKKDVKMNGFKEMENDTESAKDIMCSDELKHRLNGEVRDEDKKEVVTNGDKTNGVKEKDTKSIPNDKSTTNDKPEEITNPNKENKDNGNLDTNGDNKLDNEIKNSKDEISDKDSKMDNSSNKDLENKTSDSKESDKEISNKEESKIENGDKEESLEKDKSEQNSEKPTVNGDVKEGEINGDVHDVESKGKGKGKSIKGKGKAVLEKSEKSSTEPTKSKPVKRQAAYKAMQIYYEKIKNDEEDCSDEDSESDEENYEDNDVDDADDVKDDDNDLEDEDDEDSDDNDDDDEDDEDSSDCLDEDDFYMNSNDVINLEEGPGFDSGCTACLALLRGRELFVANVGDSRAVICRAGKAIDMSIDHKPEDQPEHDRIVKAGGRVTPDGRVNNGLNLSRALGDHGYKQNKNIPPVEQMISPLPDVKSMTLTEEDQYLIVACDGIWNSMDSQEACDFVSKRIDTMKLSEICEEMFTFCLAPNTHGDGTGCDNMTCIIVKFNNLSLLGAGSIKRTSSASSPSQSTEDAPPSQKKQKTTTDDQ